MTLEGLCKYYINCVGLENNTTLRASMKDEKSFIAVPWYNFNFLNKGEVLDFLMNAQHKELDIFLGYPILKVSHHLVPVFLTRIIYDNGSRGKREGYYPDDELQINKDVIDRYSTNDKTENIYELRKLEEEIGFNDGMAELVHLDELVQKLRSIRPNWEWVEELNPNDLKKGRVSLCEPNGVLNRAIIFSKEPTPYTVGLLGELDRLQSMREEDIRGSILWKFLHGKTAFKKNFEGAVLEVMPLNEEQRQAVTSALSADVSLIAGPPGTGKTQVVANLIVNAAIAGQSVLFTSKNNNAVDVVVKRVNEFDKKLPLILRFDKSVKQSIADYTMPWYNAKSGNGKFESAMNEYCRALNAYEMLIRQKNSVVEVRNRLDELDQTIGSLRERYPHLFGKLRDAEVREADEFLMQAEKVRDEKLNGPKTLWSKLMKTRWEKNLEESATKAFEGMNHFMAQFNDALQAYPDMTEREWMHFKNVYTTITGDLHKIADYNYLMAQLRDNASLEQLDVSMVGSHAEMQSKAKKAWQYWLQDHVKVFNAAQRARLLDYMNSLENDKVDDFPPVLLPLFPASAITSLSARRRIPFKAGLYDLLIIDEASQCDIASMIPLMMRARRVAVIGDKQQLGHICLLNGQTDEAQMKANGVLQRWSYRTSSIYDLAMSMVSAENIVQLRDHHRSFLDIIQFSNQEFYGNTLRVATDYSRLNAPNNGKPIQGMQWMNVKGRTVRPESGGAYNLQEVEAVLRILRRLSVELGFEGSIGVTTPFHFQAEMIQKTLERDDELRNHLELHNQLLIDTVHKFQGDERDVIVFSPVVSEGTKSQSLSFLKSTGNLFNVAITRARALLVTVGDKEYCKNCGVSYLEHFAEYDTGAQVPVEASEWEHLLQQALSDAGIPVTAQYHVDKYYLDLALFHNGRKLDIEVDGAMYHQTWSGELCYNDQLRNQALMRQGWNVMRFWVQQVRDQMPWCVEQVKRWMAQGK